MTDQTDDRAGSIWRRPFAYNPSFIPSALVASDFLSILISFFIVFYLKPLEGGNSWGDFFVISFFLFLYFIIAERTEIFAANSVLRTMRYVSDVIFIVLIALCIMMYVVTSLDLAWKFNISRIVTFSGLSLIIIVLARLIVATVIFRLVRERLLGVRVAVLGDGQQARRFIEHYAKVQPFFGHLVGYFSLQSPSEGASSEPPSIGELAHLGDVSALIEMARADQIDDVVVALPWNEDENTVLAIETLKELPINVLISSDLVGFRLRFTPALGALRQVPVFEVIQKPISGWGYVVKMLEDYVLATIGLILISPLLLIVAALIKFDSKGPVFFKQRRLGFNNKVFHIYKFRSMYHEPQDDAVVRQATRGDPRVTRVGQFIRATSIDELPQLFNVLLGDMSLVGPRPHALSHNEEYGRQIRGYFARQRVKPGITGWAQINGLRGETKTLDEMRKRVEHDIHYTENWSLLFDIKILILTVVLTLFQKNAY